MKSSTSEVKLFRLKENDLKIQSWKFSIFVLFYLQKLSEK